MSKVIVIGANHAGTACINFILSNAPGCDLTVYDRNTNISFLGCGMALWIGGQIRGSEGLFYSNKEKLEQAGAKVHMESEVTEIDFINKKVYVRLKTGETITDSYDQLVIATGSLPIIPNIPGADLENVQKVKIFQDAQEVIDKIKDPEIKHVTVVGAGYIGVELAEAFERHGKNVLMIDIAETCLTNYYDEKFTDQMNENLRSNHVKCIYGEKVIEIKGNEKVSSIQTDKNEYFTDMVVMCIGFRPNNELGKNQLKLYKNGAYLVNRNQETSEKDVYAIGDCATVFDNATEDINYIALATNAVRSGIVAAYNVCGIPLETIGVQGSNGISIYGLNMVSTGLTMKRAKQLGIDASCVDYEDLQKPEFIETENPSVTIRIVYENKTRRIIGAQMSSRYDISMGIHMFSLAIQEKVTIDRLKLTDIFFLPHFNKPYNYITMAALQA